MKIKKPISVFIIVCFLSAASGCYGTYEAERKFWLANRQYERLMRDVSQAASSDKAERLIADRAPDIIIALREVTLNYPSLPLSAQAMLMIANVYAAEGRLERAAEEYRAVINNFAYMKEQCASAMAALASIYREKGDWAASEGLYQQVMSDYLDTQAGLQVPILVARYYRSRAMNTEAKTAYSKAIALYEKFIETNKDHPYSMYALEQLMGCYGDLGEWDEALSYLDSLMLKHPQLPLTLQAMLIAGTIYEVEFNDRGSALEIYRQAVAMFPDDPASQRIQNRLKLHGD